MQLTTTCAGVERLLGRHEEAHARLVAGLDQLPDPAAADAISLMIELAIDALFRAEPEAVRDWATRALGAARELGERPLIAAVPRRTSQVRCGFPSRPSIAGKSGRPGSVTVQPLGQDGCLP